MHLDPKDAQYLDALLKTYQTRASQEGKPMIARTIETMRDHLPKEGGVTDEKLVMDIQFLLLPLLENDDPAGPPETMKAHVRELFKSMDRGRSSQ